MMNQHDFPDPSEFGDTALRDHALRVIEVLMQRDLLSICVPSTQGLICESRDDIEWVCANGKGVDIMLRTRFGEPEQNVLEQ